MRTSRNNGKKILANNIVRHAFEIIHLMTNENPIQVLVTAIENCGPREDSTRIGSAGAARRQAVDVAPLRRVNTSVFLIAKGAKDSSFRKVRTVAECLAEEIIQASRASASSYAIRTKDATERIAKSNR
jgi:small subunit ribosomal protein S5e